MCNHNSDDNVTVVEVPDCNNGHINHILCKFFSTKDCDKIATLITITI